MATITCPPNADVRAIHHRMPVIFEGRLVDDWLAGLPVKTEPFRDGALRVEVAEGMD